MPPFEVEMKKKGIGVRQASGVKVKWVSDSKFTVEQKEVPQIPKDLRLSYLEPKVRIGEKDSTRPGPEIERLAQELRESNPTVLEAIHKAIDIVWGLDPHWKYDIYKEYGLHAEQRAKELLEEDPEALERLKEKWNKEFGNRNAEQILKSGYTYGCGDNSTLFAGLLHELGIETHAVQGVPIYENAEHMAAGVATGSGHTWTEAKIEGKWVPIDASQRKIGFRPLESGTPGNNHLIPVRVSAEPEHGSIEQMIEEQPHLHKCAD